MTDRYRELVEHYEACLERHGDSHRGVDWPDAEGARTRYEVMLDGVRGRAAAPVSLLDFGCGAAHLYEHLQRHGLAGWSYQGVDLSPRFVALCRAKHPDVAFHCGDVLDPSFVLPEVDWIVANGVFTEKRGLTQDEMLDFVTRVLPALFGRARVGIAFNVMSAHVDWQRDDLFHLPFDVLAAFLRERVSRHFAMRQDYGLYEYTTYVYRDPVSPGQGSAIRRPV